MHLGEPYCKFCRDEVESITHVLLDFPLAHVMCMHLVPLEDGDNLFHSSLFDWIQLNVFMGATTRHSLWGVFKDYNWLWRGVTNPWNCMSTLK